MALSNYRNTRTNTVHHLGSRIAHKVYFLEEDERNDFLEMLFRVATFTGIKLLGWCIMSNHFHLLVYLPNEEIVSEQEVLRRYEAIKGRTAVINMESTIAKWRESGVDGENFVNGWLDSQRRRMYSISEFMKILKQWFTVEYNRRHAHRGTLWESVYFDRVVKSSESDISQCLAYIHLNPIRAALVTSFDGYAWSSYSSFKRGEQTATEGMRFIYGTNTSNEEMSVRHEELMRSLLEEEKLRRALEIAHKTAGGYLMPRDPLTTEAEVAQASARMQELEREIAAYRVQRNTAESAQERYNALCEETLSMIKIHPGFNVGQLLDAMAVSRSVLYRILSDLKSRGLVQSSSRGNYSPVGQKV